MNKEDKIKKLEEMATGIKVNLLRIEKQIQELKTENKIWKPKQRR